MLIFDQKSENLNTSITTALTIFTYQHERARNELRHCETNAQRERCFLATRVKFANSEEEMVVVSCAKFSEDENM